MNPASGSMTGGGGQSQALSVQPVIVPGCHCPWVGQNSAWNLRVKPSSLLLHCPQHLSALQSLG